MWSQCQVTVHTSWGSGLTNLLMHLSTWLLSPDARPMTNISAKKQTMVLRSTSSQNCPSHSRHFFFFLLTLDMCFCWVLFFFFSQTVSRWVIKVWDLKSIYEPADLTCSAGSVYNCESFWTTLHILLFLLPSQTPPPLLLQQHTLSSGELIGCSSFVYLFKLRN